MDFQQIKDEYLEFYKEEEEIKNEVYNNEGIEKGFKKYCLLDKNWVKKYKIFLNESIRDENKKYYLFDYKSIIIKKEHKEIFNGKYSFDLPINFTLVKEEFINIISKHLTKIEKQSIRYFNIIIGGNCLIMNDYKKESYFYAYITLYNEEIKDFDNNIDFILRINDKEEMKKAINSILTKNIWNYFKELNFDYKEVKYKTLKKYKYSIDFIERIVDINKINKIYNANIKQIKNGKIMTQIFKKKQIEDEHNKITHKINSFLYCLYQIKELEKIINQNDNNNEISKLFIDFYQNFEKKELYNNNQIIQFFLKSIKGQNFQSIIKEIFERINLDIFKDKQKDFDINQVNIYDEKNAKNKFLEDFKNFSIFKRCFIFQKKKLYIVQNVL